LKLALCSFEILRRIDWWFLTDDVLGQPISASFKGQADKVFMDALTLEDGIYVVPKWWQQPTDLCCVKCQKSKDLIYTVADLKSCRFEVAS
jgi:hypothetical protein